MDAQEFPGGIPEAEHILAFCQASFRMTLSRVGFLTLAPGNGGGAGPCSTTFSLESECVHLFWRGGNCREMGPKHVCPISFHVICWLLTWVFGEVNGTPFQYSCLENPMDGGAW